MQQKPLRHRILSLLLCAALLLGLVPAMSRATPVHAATASQNNIVARADYMYNILWTCQQDVYGWNYGTLFEAGSRYRVPYGQPIYSGAYIGYYVDIDDFISAANTPGSVFYTSRSTYETTSSVYYATDCSAFVSWCWGVDRKTTYSIPLVSTYIGMATAANTSLLQIGDCLNSNDVGHVVLVTDLVYNSSGTLTSIEITEQTPPQLKRSYWTPSDLGSYYGSYYGIYRYTGTVPAAPDGSTNSGSSSDTSGKYYPACSSSATTFYGGMSEIGISCDWDLHTRIAQKNGITDFSGTAEQNEQLLTLLKAGTLLNPDYTDSDSSSDGTVTSGSNGYERGYEGGMAGSGEYKAFGLDVSSWQGSSLNFTRIKNAGYDYVILRAGTTNGKDTCFETYYTNAKAAGLDVGAYYYSYATSVSSVKTDMEDFLSYIAGKKFEYPIYFDYEDASQQALSASLSQQICLTAMDMLAAEGYLVGMYTGKYFSTQLPMDTICAKYEVWIAHYLSSGVSGYDGTGDYWKYGPTYASQYGMYQFTDSVWISGYGPYDGDVCYKDYPAIVKKYGFNGYEAEISDDSYLGQCTYYPSHAKLKVTEDTVIDSEPRSASDDLESISAGTEITATGLYANTSTNMWYQVKTSDGKTGYLYSQRTEYLGVDTSDIMVTGYSLPTDHAVGDVFVVNGTISSSYNKLNRVAVYIYEGKTTATDPVTGADAAVSNNSYTLANSDIDTATSFDDLTTGIYTYAISANYTSYYASAKREATAVSENILLLNHAFSVGGAVLEETYFDECTFYPSRVLFTTNRDTSIFSEPRTQKTGNTSVALEAAPNGTQYSSTGLYVNAGGNIFYQVTTTDGQDGYIYSGYTDFNKKAYDDIEISGAVYPNGHVKGNTFIVTGTVKSTYNTLGTLKVQVFSGVDTSGTPITGGSATVSNNNYSLAGSAIDYAVAMDDLSTGLYTYLITVTFSSYYAKSPTELGTATGTRTVKRHYFTVVSSSVDQSTCSHSNSETVVEAATCTATGTKVVSCSKCGMTEKATIEKTSHNYGSYSTTLEPTCTTAGSKQKVCTDCGKIYTEEIAATGHSYSEKVTTAASCGKEGVKTFTCANCGDTYTESIPALEHNYVDGTCQSCGEQEKVEVLQPSFEFTGASLLFEDEIFYNFYFMPSNTADVVEYGVITFTTKLADGTHADAVDVIPGAVDNGDGTYTVRTNGIPAKEMGDWLYFRVYAKLSDDSYAYATTYGYRATAYANTVLSGNSDAKTKALMVAMLNYGAAAQTYFSHNTDSLMNASLTEDQKALVDGYSADMLGGIVAADSSKTAAFPKDSTCYTPRIAVGFEGAFAVNYYFTPKHTPDGELTMYYWDAATYNSISEMTRENATSVMTLEKQPDGSYLGAVEGIAAKEVDSTIYVALVYTSGGTEYCSGILAYSLGTYFKSVAGGTSTAQPLGAAVAAYSYYAKQYFAN